MTKLVHITDLHFANKPPASRIDDYNETLFKKLEWVVKFANKKKADALLLGGDMWHTYQPNIHLFLRFLDILNGFVNPVYFIWGNHDIQGSNTDHIDRTAFGFMNRMPFFKNIHKKPVEFDDCTLTGYNYSVKEDCQLHWPWPEKIKTKKMKVLLTHPMITRERSIVVDDIYKQVNFKEITTDADIMLCGHYHGGFTPHEGEYEGKNFLLANPGSFGRVNPKEAKESIGPALTYIQIKGKESIVDYVKIPTLKIKDIFDLSERARKKRKKENINDFKETLEELSESNIMGDNFAQALTEVLEDPPEDLKSYVHNETIQLCKEHIRKHSE